MNTIAPPATYLCGSCRFIYPASTPWPYCPRCRDLALQRLLREVVMQPERRRMEAMSLVLRHVFAHPGRRWHLRALGREETRSGLLTRVEVACMYPDCDFHLLLEGDAAAWWRALERAARGGAA